MFIIWGSYYCGKCDEVPRLCHVETHFGHLYYIPLIPIGSYAVFGRTNDGGIQGIPLGVSMKSVVLGWLRAGCVLGAIGCAAATVIMATDLKTVPLAIVAGLFTVACIGLFVATKKLAFFTRASYERALEIAQRAGVTPEGMLMIEVAYGRLNAEQADMELQKIEARQLEAERLEQERFAREGGPAYNYGQGDVIQAEIVP